MTIIRSPDSPKSVNLAIVNGLQYNPSDKHTTPWS